MSGSSIVSISPVSIWELYEAELFGAVDDQVFCPSA